MRRFQGTFLATISILSSTSDQFSRAYSTILDLQEFCAPMKKLTVYFNKETDLLMWKKVNHACNQLLALKDVDNRYI